MQTAIYSLRDPRTGVTRYIGKTRQKPLRRRFTGHANSARNGEDTHKGRWLRELDTLGMEARIDLIQIVDGDGCAEEIQWIAKMRAMGWQLVNSSAGGDGLRSGSHSPETIEKIRDALTGKKHSPETIELRASKLRGRKYTEEHRAKALANRKTLKWTDAQKKAQSDRYKGRPQPQLQTAKAMEARMKSMTRGQRHPASKLTDTDVSEILSSAETQQVLAERFGVGQDQISRIKSGKRWAHMRRAN
jgi:hypothetical protein